MISFYEIITRILLGAIIGGIIGFEREVHGRAAGFRTQLIVCLAAVLIMIVSENYYYYIPNTDPNLRIDPARISAGALIGIGFLGAGVIIKSGYAIRGLTTAASIWIVSAIGLAIGGGLYLAATVTGATTVIALWVLRILEKKIKILRFRNISVSVPLTEKTAQAEETVTSILSGSGFHIHSVDYEKNTGGEIIYHFSVSTRDRGVVRKLFAELCSLEFVSSVKISS
ncbi:MAG: MgtC/SapB family protein [Deferribacteres bacterium]|nr:MgtC/SapB family protein [Deferribacteres bacterium]